MEYVRSGEKDIKEEFVWLERGETEVKYEAEEVCLQNEGGSSLETCSSSNNIEIKEEQWWEKVKPELVVPETLLPIEPKACIVEDNAVIQSSSSSSHQKCFQINRNKSLLNEIGKKGQVDAAKVGAHCECQLNCFVRINGIERNRIMEHFQKLSYSNLQSVYLLNCLKLNHKEEGTDLSSRHNSSLQYFVQTIEGEMVKVCETAFFSIHGLQNNTEVIDNIAAVLKKANLKSSYESLTTEGSSQKDPTSLSNLQNAVRLRNSILLFKNRKPFLKVSRPLTWRKKRALAILLLHRLRLQLHLQGVE